MPHNNQPSPTGFLSLKLPPPPCDVVLLVQDIENMFPPFDMSGICLHLALLAFSLLVSTGPYLEHFKLFQVQVSQVSGDAFACLCDWRNRSSWMGSSCKDDAQKADFRLNPSVRGWWSCMTYDFFLHDHIQLQNFVMLGGGTGSGHPVWLARCWAQLASTSSFNDRVCRHRVKRRASCQCTEVSGFFCRGNWKSRGKRQQQHQHQDKEYPPTKNKNIQEQYKHVPNYYRWDLCVDGLKCGEKTSSRTRTCKDSNNMGVCDPSLNKRWRAAKGILNWNWTQTEASISMKQHWISLNMSEFWTQVAHDVPTLIPSHTCYLMFNQV